MLRRQARLRREYLVKKSAESKQSKYEKNKEILKKCLSSNKPIPGHLKKAVVSMQDKLMWNSAENNFGEEYDDDYRYAGCQDPKIIITTSHEPSSRLKMFVKEMRLIFPNSQRINRGKHEIRNLMQACQANNVTDFIIIHENRGVPDNLIISHLPNGPTAYFNISNVVMRHDIVEVKPMSEQKPHLVFHNFKTKLGNRTKTILKHLFPVPKENSTRVITFANHDDYICFRHHTYEYKNKELNLTEVGPRFQLKLYKIMHGTLAEASAAHLEWKLRPYMNKNEKRRFLSDDDGWKDEHDDIDMI